MQTTLQPTKADIYFSRETLSRINTNPQTIMDNIMMDNLPKDVVNILAMLFGKGNVVKDFKLVGNSNGFAVTLHICNPYGDPPILSPSNIRTSQAKHKCSAAYNRDQQRQKAWASNIPCVSSPICSIEKSATSQNIDQGEYDISHVDKQHMESHVSVSKEEKVSEVHDNDTDQKEKEHLNHSGEFSKNNGDDNENAQPESEVSRARAVLTNPDKNRKLKSNILNKIRNKSFDNIIHDHRRGENNVVGITDDIVLLFDITKEKFTHWLLLDGKPYADDDELNDLL